MRQLAEKYQDRAGDLSWIIVFSEFLDDLQGFRVFPVRSESRDHSTGAGHHMIHQHLEYTGFSAPLKLCTLCNVNTLLCASRVLFFLPKRLPKTENFTTGISLIKSFSRILVCLHRSRDGFSYVLWMSSGFDRWSCICAWNFDSSCITTSGRITTAGQDDESSMRSFFLPDSSVLTLFPPPNIPLCKDLGLCVLVFSQHDL